MQQGTAMTVQGDGAGGSDAASPFVLRLPPQTCYGCSMSETDTKSIFDTPPDEELEARLDAEAEAEIEAGKGVPHDKVSAWLRRRASGEKVPPPEA